MSSLDIQILRDPIMSTDKPEKRTAEISRTQRQAFRRIREELDARRPSLEEALATGEYEGPHRMGDYWEAAKAIVRLRKAREAAGLTQRELSERTGIDPTAISRIESGRQPNVTLRTLQRLAGGIGCWLLVDVSSRDSPVGSVSEGDVENFKAAARHGGEVSPDEAAEITRFAGKLAEKDKARRGQDGRKTRSDRR